MLPNSLGNLLDNRVGQLQFLVVVDSLFFISSFFIVGHWAMWGTQVHYKPAKNIAKDLAYKPISLLR